MAGASTGAEGWSGIYTPGGLEGSEGLEGLEGLEELEGAEVLGEL